MASPPERPAEPPPPPAAPPVPDADPALPGSAMMAPPRRRRSAFGPARRATPDAAPGPVFLIVLTMVTFMGPLSLHMFFPAVPAVRTAFAVDESLAQLSASLPMFTMAFLTLVYGALSDRLGRRPMLLAGILLFAVGCAIAAAANSIWLLLAGRLVQAAGGACGLALARAIARDVYGAERLVKAIAYLTMAYALGPMLSAPIGGLLVDQFGWRSVPVFSAVAGGVLVTLAYLAIFETHPPAARVSDGPDGASDGAPDGASDGAGRGGSWLGDYRRLFSNMRFTAYVLQAGFSAAVFFSMATGSAFLMTDYLNRPPAEFGLYFPLFPIGFVIGNFVATRLASRVSTEGMLLAASVVLVAGVVAQAVAILAGALSPASIFVPGLVVTFSNGLSAANAQAGAIRTAGNLAGTAAGVGVFMPMMAGGLFTQLFGLLADGTPTPFVVTIGIATVLAAVMGVIPYLIVRRERAGA